MSYTDDSSDQDWKETNVRKKESTSGSKPKYFQKFCEKWMDVFHPWLARCEDDLNKPFCRACQCRLDCNRCHLQRHARTFKHARNLEILISKGEGAARENLGIRQERSKYYQQRKKLNVSQDLELAMDTTEDYTEDTGAGEGNFQFVQTENNSNYHLSDEQSMKQEMVTPDVLNSSKRKHKERTNMRSTTKKSNVPVKKERNKLLMQIQKDKNDLMDSFKELIGGGAGITFSQSPARERNHVDLFFESVSSSVKALTPKLIAEAKMRVSQLICELELRALTESDGNKNDASASSPMVIVPEANNSYVVNPQPHPTQDRTRRSEFDALS